MKSSEHEEILRKLPLLLFALARRGKRCNNPDALEVVAVEVVAVGVKAGVFAKGVLSSFFGCSKGSQGSFSEGSSVEV